jgi:hypothetical protein
MITIELWIDAQICTIENCVGILRECEKEKSIDKIIIQLWAMKKHIDSTLEFLERKRKFHGAGGLNEKEN